MCVYKYLGQYLFVNKYLLNKIMETNCVYTRKQNFKSLGNRREIGVFGVEKQILSEIACKSQSSMAEIKRKCLTYGIFISIFHKEDYHSYFSVNSY